MKFFAVLALFVAVASAGRLLPGSIPAAVVSQDQQQAEIQEILAAIQHPSTDPATAALLEEMLFDILGIDKPIVPEPAPVDQYQPIAIGPAIIEEPQPIIIGPAIVDQPQPIIIGPAIVDQPQPIIVEPVIVEEAPVAAAPADSASAPLVQIILNIISQSGAPVSSPITVEGFPVNPSPVVVAEPIVPTPVIEGEISPTPVTVVEGEIVPDPVLVEELVPEPAVIGTPILPAPVAILPEELN